MQTDDEHAWRSRIRSALPVITWLPQYQRSWLRSDLVAGLTLAAYAVPVSVAYASLAGLPPQAGLYCYLVGRSRLCSFWNLPPTGHRANFGNFYFDRVSRGHIGGW